MRFLSIEEVLEISASVDEQERIILKVASGQSSRQEFTTWVDEHVRQRAR